MGEKSEYKCKDFGDIARCFQQLHLHINTEVETLKQQQKEIQNRVELIENQSEFLSSELHDIHNKHIPNIEAKIQEESTERIKLELWGRKWNVVIRGIKGAVVSRELPKVTDALVRKFLIDILRIEEQRAKAMRFTAVHRLPSGDPTKKNVILRLSSLIDRDDILQAVTKLEPGSGFSVVPDLPPTLAIRRGALLKERRERCHRRREKGQS